MKPCISCGAKEFVNGVCSYCGTKNSQTQTVKQTIYYIEKQNENIPMMHIVMVILIATFCLHILIFFKHLSENGHSLIFFADKLILFLSAIKLVLYSNLLYIYFKRGKKFLLTLIYFIGITFSINVFSAIYSSDFNSGIGTSFYLGDIILSIPLIIFIMIYISNYKNNINAYFSKDINDNKWFGFISWVAVILIFNVLRNIFSPSTGLTHNDPDFGTPVVNQPTPEEFITSTNQFDVMEKDTICKKAFGIRTTYDASLSSDGIGCKCSNGFYINLRGKCVSELVEPRMPTSQNTRIIAKDQIFLMQNLPMPESTSDDYADQRQNQSLINTGTQGKRLSIADMQKQKDKELQTIGDKYIADLGEIDYTKYDAIYKEAEEKFAYSTTLKKYVLDKLFDGKDKNDQENLAKDYIQNMGAHDPYNMQEYYEEITKVKDTFQDQLFTKNYIISELNKIHLNK